MIGHGNSTVMMELRKTPASPSKEIQESGKGTRTEPTAATPSSNDLHLLETLSSQSEESNGSPLWIQMSEYGPDDTGVSPFDDVDSRFGDWYDDYSCNFTVSSARSV